MAYLKSVLCTLLLFKKPDVLLTFPPSPSNLCYSIAFGWWNIQFQEQRNMYPLQFVLFSYLQVPKQEQKVGKVTSEKSQGYSLECGSLIYYTFTFCKLETRLSQPKKGLGHSDRLILISKQCFFFLHFSRVYIILLAPISKGILLPLQVMPWA